MQQFVDDLVVEEIQNSVTSFDDGDVDIQGAEDGGVFDADDTGPDDGDGARQLIDFKNVVGIENAFAVERDMVRAVGAGTDGDQDMLTGDTLIGAVFLLDFQSVGVFKAGMADQNLHAVAVQFVAHHLHLVV